MKRSILLLLLAALLLCGCTAKSTGPSEAHAPAETETRPVDEQRILVGVWRNEGQYAEGHEFVETMTLDEGGICTIHLTYQGADYQTLEGVYLVENGTLSVTLEGADGSYERDYRYTLDGDTLVLENGEKTVTYLRAE